MTIILDKINPNDVTTIVNDREVVKFVQANTEPTFVIRCSDYTPKNDELVDIEVSLRKGKRVGLFTKTN